MKAKRAAPQRRNGDRRRAHDNTLAKSKRRTVEPTPRRRPRTAKASAPAREPRGSRSAPQTNPMSRPAERPARPKNTSQAKARAKARKAKAPKVIRPPLRERLLTRLASIDLRPRTLAAKVPFVVLVIGALGTGLGITLWLSTDSAERSYQLGNARAKNQVLQQQKEALERDVLQEQAAPALAEAARKLGMIPTRDTAHLIQDPAGSWVVVGTPKPAEGAPPPPLNTKLPDEKPAPPPAPVNSAEVPVLVMPGIGVPVGPGMNVPGVLPSDPNAATTLGAQPAVVPQAPAMAPPIAAPPPAPPANAEQFGPLTVTTPGSPR